MLDVDLDHLIAYNEDLAHRLVDTPAEVLPLVRCCGSPSIITDWLMQLILQQFEEALRRSARQILMPLRAAALNIDEEDREEDAPEATPAEERYARKEGPEIQVTLRSNARLMEFRDLHVCLCLDLINRSKRRCRPPRYRNWSGYLASSFLPLFFPRELPDSA